MASTSTGLGYWLFASNGNVFAYGDAEDFGGLADQDLQNPVIGGDNHGSTGYWLTTAAGRVSAFGAAPSLGSPDRVAAPVVGFAADPAGSGYWLLGAKGKLMSFGDASSIGTARALTGTTTTQRDVAQVLGDSPNTHEER
jgi:hypothetical protein